MTARAQTLPYSAATRADRRPRGAVDSRRGQSLVEFTLTFMLFLGLLLGFVQLAYCIWAKTALHYAVRQGARFAITGSTLPGLGHDDSIKATVKKYSAGLLADPALDGKIVIEYFDDNGNTPTGVANAGGNTVVVSVEGYDVPLMFGSLSGANVGAVHVSAVDKLEPYTIPPPQ